MDLVLGLDDRDIISLNIVLFIEEINIALENQALMENKSPLKLPNVNNNKTLYEGLKDYLLNFGRVKIFMNIVFILNLLNKNYSIFY